MPPHDPDAELIHPDAAGWVLGVLEPEDADRFAGHLPSCADCRAVVAELSPAALMLATAARAELPPAAIPPANLQARTLAAVAEAAAADRRADRLSHRADLRSRRADLISRWRDWPVRMVSLAAAVVVAVVVSAGFLLSGSAPAQAYTATLHPAAGLAAAAAVPSGRTVETRTSSGWSVQLTVAHLPELAGGQVYECWWSGPGNGPGQRDLSSAGTFTVGSSGTATVQMWTAAGPDSFPVVQIAVETAGQANQLGRVILTGTINDDD